MYIRLNHQIIGKCFSVKGLADFVSELQGFGVVAVIHLMAARVSSDVGFSDEPSLSGINLKGRVGLLLVNIGDCTFLHVVPGNW